MGKKSGAELMRMEVGWVVMMNRWQVSGFAWNGVHSRLDFMVDSGGLTRESRAETL